MSKTPANLDFLASIQRSVTIAEARDVVRSLLDNAVDAFDPQAALDRIFPGHCPACKSTKVTEPDDEGLVDCGDCGIWFDPLHPNNLGESEEDVSPIDYIHDLELPSNWGMEEEEYSRGHYGSESWRLLIDYGTRYNEFRLSSHTNHNTGNPRDYVAGGELKLIFTVGYYGDAVVIVPFESDADYIPRRDAVYAVAKQVCVMMKRRKSRQAYLDDFMRLCEPLRGLASSWHVDSFIGESADPDDPAEFVASMPDLPGPRITISYYKVSPESAANGDYEETGWIDEEGVSMEPDEFDYSEGITAADKAIKFLKKECATRQSSSHFHVGVWYSDGVSQDYRTGVETELAYHLHGFTEEQEKQIWNAIVKRPPAV
jgi:hypothetical protein